MKYLLFYISVYNFIFPIRLNIIPKFEVLLFTLPLLWLLINFKKNKHIFNHHRYKTSLLFIIILIILGTFSSLFNQGDFLSVLVFFKFFFTIILSTSILLWGMSLFGDIYFEKILSIIIISGLIISITNVIEYFSPTFRIFLLNIINVTGNTDYEMSFRTHGFASSGGASLSVGILVVSLISFFKSKISKDKFERFLFYTLFILIYMSIIIIGRTGLFLGLPIVIYILFFEGISIFSLFKKAFIFFLILFSTTYLISILSEDDVNIFFKYGLEPIYNYIEYGSFTSKTTAAVSKMYFFPDFIHIIFGAGFWRYPTYNYALPDTGYMKTLLSTGIFGVIIFYSYQIKIYREIYIFLSKKYKLKILFFYLLLIPFLGELKESFFTQNYTFKILSLLIVYSWIFKMKNRTLIKKIIN